MKKLKSKSIYITILLMVVTSFPLRLLAKEYRVKDVPNVQLRDARQRVSDPEGLLSTSARDTINHLLMGLKQRQGIEVAVVMMPNIGDSDLFDFAHELFRTWGIGGKQSNGGLLILYVEDIHRVRITVGDGLEGTMTDAICKRIIEREMIPYFRRGDRDGGMVSGVKATCTVVKGEKLDDSVAEDPEDDIDLWVVVLFMAMMVGGFFVIVWAVNRSTRKCKYCGKVGLRLVNTDTYRKDGRQYKRETYICNYCGKITTKVKDTTDDGTGAAIASGVILGAMLGGRRGGSYGGGFSGGSWGGGTTSGGGASGGW